jgi:hypothetical protein
MRVRSPGGGKYAAAWKPGQGPALPRILSISPARAASSNCPARMSRAPRGRSSGCSPGSSCAVRRRGNGRQCRQSRRGPVARGEAQVPNRRRRAALPGGAARAPRRRAHAAGSEALSREDARRERPRWRSRAQAGDGDAAAGIGWGHSFGCASEEHDSPAGGARSGSGRRAGCARRRPYLGGRGAGPLELGALGVALRSVAPSPSFILLAPCFDVPSCWSLAPLSRMVVRPGTDILPRREPWLPCLSRGLRITCASATALPGSPFAGGRRRARARAALP